MPSPAIARQARDETVVPFAASKTVSLLVVEDNRGDYILLCDRLGRIDGTNYEIEWTKTVPEAIAALNRKEHDAALVDFQLIGGTGLDILREGISIEWPAPIIVMTGYDDMELDATAMKLGAYDFIWKGEQDPQRFERSIRYAIERKRMDNVALATNRDLVRYITVLRDAKSQIEQQRQRIVSLAYHLASAGHGEEPTGMEVQSRRRRPGESLQGSELGIWSFDANGRSFGANEVALSLFEIDDLERLFETELEHLVSEKGLDSLRALMRSLETSEQATVEIELVGQRTGRRSWVVMSLLAEGEQDGAQVYATSIVDITNRRHVEESTRYLARHDSLTGLYNRAAFEEYLRQATAIARRNETLVAVLCLDLDGFKTVNDTWGHKAGDHLLKEAGQRIRSVTRESDTVARIGGDEFVVLATNLHRPEDAAPVASAIVEALGAPYEFRGREIRCGASVGVALYPEDSDDTEHLMEFADIALYRAKSAGSGLWRYFDEHRNETATPVRRA